jgi:hypothetical protein
MNDVFFQKHEEKFKKLGYDVTFQFKQTSEPYRLKTMYFTKGYDKLEMRFKFSSEERDLVFHPNILLDEPGEDALLTDILLPFLSFIKEYAILLSIPVVFCDNMFFTKCMNPKKATYCFEKEAFRYTPQELSKYFYDQHLFSKRSSGWFYCTDSFALPKEYEMYDRVHSFFQQKKKEDPILDFKSLLPSTDISYYYNGYSGFLKLSHEEDMFTIEDEKLLYKRTFNNVNDITDIKDLFEKISTLYRVKNIFYPPNYFYNKYFQGAYAFSWEIQEEFYKGLSTWYRPNEIEHYFSSHEKPITQAHTNGLTLYKIMDVYFLGSHYGEFVKVSKNEKEVKQIMIERLFSTL